MGSKPLTAFAPAPRPARTVPVERRASAVDALISLLTVLALVCAWATAVILVEAAGVKVEKDGNLSLIEVKSALFYGAHGLSIASIMAAGVLSAISGRLRNIPASVRAALYILFTLTLIWAALSYKWEEVFSSAELFGATGPFVWLTLVLVVAAADRRIWVYLDPVIRFLGYATTALALRALLAHDYTAYRGFSKYIQYSIMLTWFGGWGLLTATRIRGWRLAVRALPAFTLVIMALCSQARSWTLISCLLLASFVLLRAWERGSMAQGIRTLAMGCLICVIAGAMFYAAAPRTLGNAVSGLMERAMDDTRSMQYTDFFRDVPATDLILGRGPRGTWYWPTVGEYKFFDNGYLWTLFEGGIPFLICYVAILVWPAVRVMRAKPTGMDAAAAILCLFWGLALTGLSTYVLPSVEMQDCLVFLLAGRCHLFLVERSRVAASRAVPAPVNRLPAFPRPAMAAR